MNRFSIKDIENLTGIKAHTLRIWEQRYGILQPKRTPTNIRYYDAADLKNALRISLLNSFGYKISRINKMTGEDMSALIQKISDQEFRLQVLVNDLLEAALSMDTVSFENQVNAYIRKHGPEQAVEDLFFSFLEKIGIMWMTDHLTAAQEHLASNILYRKIAVAIESLPAIPDNAPQVLLFLPEGEIHEISLLYIHYLVHKSGKRPVYLGPNTPLHEATAVYDTIKPMAVYIHLTSVADDFEGQRYFKKLDAALPAARMLISGPVLQKGKYKPTDNMHFVYSLAEAKEAIANL